MRNPSIVTDCQMPRMHGVALTEAIRAIGQISLRRIPIIGLTADVTETQRSRCLAAGMSDLAIKPLNLKRLTALIAHHFANAVAVPTPAEAPVLRAAVFDDSIFLALFEPGDKAGAEWLRNHLAVAREDLAGLFDLVTARDRLLPDLVSVSHRLAGACHLVGAMVAGAAARALETAARSGDATALPNLMAALSETVSAADAAITVFLAQSDVAGLVAPATV